MIWIQQHAELLFCLVGCMLVTVIPRVGPVMYLHAESLPDLLRQRRHAGILHQRRQILPYGQELPGHDRREAGHAGGGHGARQGEV